MALGTQDEQFPEDALDMASLKMTVPSDPSPQTPTMHLKTDQADKPKVGLRPRKSTAELMGVTSQSKALTELLEEIDQLPPPEEDIDGYTKSRLQRGLRFVDRRLRKDRDITPRTTKFLKMQKQAYKDALEVMDEQSPTPFAKLLKSLAAVQTYDQIYHSETFLYRNISEEQLKTVRALRKLKEMELLAKYGDALALQVKSFRVAVFNKREDEAEEKIMQAVRPTFSSELLWTEIAKLLDIDPANVEQWKTEPGEKSIEKGASYALLQACHLLGYDYRHQHEVITTYAQRNDTFHSYNIWVESCSWGKLAEHLYHDIKELALTLNDEQCRFFHKTLTSVRDIYLVVKLPDDPSSWVPTPHALKLTDAKIAADKKKAERVAKNKGQAAQEVGVMIEGSRRQRRRQKAASAALSAEVAATLSELGIGSRS